MSAKPMWKVTIRTGYWPIIIAGGGWHERVRVYRHKWRVRLAWWSYFLTYSFAPPGFARQFDAEPYWPESNVILLRRSA